MLLSIDLLLAVMLVHHRVTLVYFAAVMRVIMQSFSSLAVTGEKQCMTTLITGAKETKGNPRAINLSVSIECVLGGNGHSES